MGEREGTCQNNTLLFLISFTKKVVLVQFVTEKAAAGGAHFIVTNVFNQRLRKEARASRRGGGNQHISSKGRIFALIVQTTVF